MFTSRKCTTNICTVDRPVDTIGLGTQLEAKQCNIQGTLNNNVAYLKLNSALRGSVPPWNSLPH
jgi:hypothetical protein